MKFICEECDKPCILEVGDGYSLTADVLGCVCKNSCYCKWKEYEDGEVENLQPKVAKLPKLTAEVFDRPDCPEWAKWAALGGGGLLTFYEDKPMMSKDEYPKRWINYDRWYLVEGTNFDASNWKNSLIKRPAKLPKLTAAVFDRTDCPGWAKYATVSNSGYAYWFEDKPLPEVDKSTISMLVSWVSYGRKQLITGLWDSSDWQSSLIERPVKEDKLPDWCKIGGWVYSTVHKEYVKIKDIDEFKVEFDRGTYHTVSHKAFREEYKPVRPYNEDEMKALMGKVIEKGHSMHIVTGFENVFDNECMVHVNGCLYSANDLLRQFTIDGKPCGVLEHLENGECVK